MTVTFLYVGRAYIYFIDDTKKETHFHRLDNLSINILLPTTVRSMTVWSNFKYIFKDGAYSLQKIFFKL